MSKGEKPNRDNTEDKDLKDPTKIVSFPLNFKIAISTTKREGATITEDKTSTMIISQDKRSTKEIVNRESTINSKRFKKYMKEVRR